MIVHEKPSCVWSSDILLHMPRQAVKEFMAVWADQFGMMMEGSITIFLFIVYQRNILEGTRKKKLQLRRTCPEVELASQYKTQHGAKPKHTSNIYLKRYSWMSQENQKNWVLWHKSWGDYWKFQDYPWMKYSRFLLMTTCNQGSFHPQLAHYNWRQNSNRSLALHLTT